MDKKKRNIIILVILCALLVGIGVFICIDIFSKDTSNNLIINNQDSNVVSDEKEEDITSNVDMNNENSNSEKNEELVDNGGIASSDNVITNESNNYSEEDVVSYFEDMEVEVSESSTFKEKFKEYFITIVDFIFYDKEIKGYTFSELSDIAKAKIISFALKIDSKIEEYIPGYKETISSTTGKIYTDIKAKLVTSYMDISSSICKDNEDECNKVKEIFSEVKDVCKIGWDFIKELISSGATKIKDWYVIYSGK